MKPSFYANFGKSLDKIYYSLEYRKSVDYDVGKDYGRLFIRYSAVPSYPLSVQTNLLYLKNENLLDLGLQAGQSFTDKRNGYDITLKSADSNGALVSIKKIPIVPGTEYYVYTKNQPPTGYLKEINSKGLLKGIIKGVAKDDDHPNASIPVNIFIDGGPGVGKAFGVTTNADGYFSMPVPGNYWDEKKHLVYAYGIKIDDPSGNSNRELQGSPQEFNLTNQPPIGYLDSVAADGKISGWAVDPDSPSQSIAVHLWLDNPAGSGIVVNAYDTNISRSDVNKNMLIDNQPIEGKHGFEIMLPSQYKNQPRKIFVYGIDAHGQPDKNTLLIGSPKEFPPK